MPKRVQTLAAKNFRLLNSNPEHPSLHLKRVKAYWSVRVGIGHRALAIPVEDGLLWFWIGTHGGTIDSSVVRPIDGDDP